MICSIGAYVFYLSNPSFRYNPDLQQAAVQMSYILGEPGCPRLHETCSKFRPLYGNKAPWQDRVATYWGSLSTNTYGENAGLGGGQYDPLYILKAVSG